MQDQSTIASTDAVALTIATLLQRALLLHQADRLADAQMLYADIFNIEPDNLDALYLDGLIAYQRGDHQRAQQRLLRALDLKPQSTPLHTALGNVYRESGLHAQAATCYETALLLNQDDADVHFNLGISQQEQGGLLQAVASYRQAVKLNPQHAEAWNNLGVALKALNDPAQAMQCYQKVLVIQPQHLTAWFNLGVLHSDQMEFEQAINCYRQALQVQPNHIDALFNLGTILKCVDAPADATACFEQVLQLQPQHAGTLQNLAAISYEHGCFDAADNFYQHALIAAPENAQLLYGRALVALAGGDYETGWAGYEARWQGAESSARHRRHFTQPQWRGEDIFGQTILLHAEQGFGDTLQFIRYAPLLAQRGVRVIVECQPALQRLLQSLAGVEQVISAGTALPSFDWHCPLLSLPLAFSTRLTSVPNLLPYLQADADLIDAWKARMPVPNAGAPRLKIGLTWAGHPQHATSRLHQFDQRRSIPLAQLAPLAQCLNVDFFSLQIGAGKQAAQPAGLALHDLTAQITDFADSAALIEQLDLVISVDTAVAHLAGALGKPVWMLSRFDACWRWMREREDSPWYPCMRIFRQSEPGNWAGVMEGVVAELNELSQMRSVS